MTQPTLFESNGQPTQAAVAHDPAPACSAASLAKVDAARLRGMVEAEYRAVGTAGAIADDITARLVAKGYRVDYFSIRPRVSELKAARILVSTGRRLLNRKGNMCAVMRHIEAI